MEEPDYVHFLEACYRIGSKPADWLRGLGEAALDLMGFGLGIHVYLVDLTQVPEPRFEEPMLVGGLPDWEERWRSDWWQPIMLNTTRDDLLSMHTMSPVNHSTEVWGALSAKSPTYAAHLASLSNRGYSTIFARYLAGQTVPPDTRHAMYPDSFNVIGTDARGIGAVLLANMPEPSNGGVPPRLAQVWNRLAAHIGAGHRLMRVAQGQSGLEDADAIFEPNGKVAHAGQDLRDSLALKSLRSQVVDIDRVRGRHRGDGPVATEVWRALHEGRYSLLDQFDRDGRRYYVARANEPPVDPLAKLTARETQVVKAAALGHSNKHIAYELGIGPSTVAVHLKAASAKLGVSSRLDLIMLIRKLKG